MIDENKPAPLVEVPVPIGAKFGTLTEVKFTYTDGGRWHTVELACGELLNVLNTGKIDDKPICAIEVVCIVVDDYPNVSYIYDFVLKATGQNPWRMT